MARFKHNPERDRPAERFNLRGRGDAYDVAIPAVIGARDTLVKLLPKAQAYGDDSNCMKDALCCVMDALNLLEDQLKEIDDQLDN